VAAQKTAPNGARENLDSTDDESLVAANDAPAPAVSASPSLVRRTVTWLCIAFGPVLSVVTYYPLIQATLQHQQWIYTIFREHYDVIFGLPSASLLSFMLVVVFEARFDKIEMEIAGLVKFKGASGPIVLWILCFFSIVTAVKLLW
jgi:hypothetical protein